jgi:CRISPR/Cas system CSM-associated protein Csm5 (group 7 of RAMP superfamily)
MQVLLGWGGGFVADGMIGEIDDGQAQAQQRNAITTNFNDRDPGNLKPLLKPFIFLNSSNCNKQ